MEKETIINIKIPEADKEVAENLADLEQMMSGWEKNSDLWNDNTKNKFRGNYFNEIASVCFPLIKKIKDKVIRINLTNKVDHIADKVLLLTSKKLPVTEDLIDEVDNFAKELIEKIKYEK